MDSEKQSSGTPDNTKQRRTKSVQAIVRCEGFRCAAYRDQSGVWRSAADGAPLEVLEVIMEFQ